MGEEEIITREGIMTPHERWRSRNAGYAESKIQRLGKVQGTCKMEVDDTRDESIEDDDSATEEKWGGSFWPQSNGRNEEQENVTS